MLYSSGYEVILAIIVGACLYPARVGQFSRRAGTLRWPSTVSIGDLNSALISLIILLSSLGTTHGSGGLVW